MQEIEFLRWLFELPAKQHSQFSPSGSTFLPCLSLPSKSHSQNSISSIFLESPHQVDMKNVVKCQKHFFCYFNALKTHGVDEGIFESYVHLNIVVPDLANLPLARGTPGAPLEQIFWIMKFYDLEDITSRFFNDWSNFVLNPVQLLKQLTSQGFWPLTTISE